MFLSRIVVIALFEEPGGSPGRNSELLAIIAEQIRTAEL